MQVVLPDSTVRTFRIGPHTPSMKNEDVLLTHRLWLNLTREKGLEKLHHHDILTEALTRFARDYAGHDRDDILRELRKITGLPLTGPPPATTPLTTTGDKPGDSPPGMDS
jgi:hypothetical protein